MTDTTEARTVTIVPVDEPDELYHHYDGQTEQQDCYLSLDIENGQMWCHYDPEIGGAVPASVYHDRVLRWPIPCLNSTAANALMDEVKPLAERVLAGASIVWNGNNNVGRLDADAVDADARIAELTDPAADRWTDDDQVSTFEAWDWFDSEGRDIARETLRDLGLSADTTDDELDQVVQRAEEQARAHYPDVVLRHADKYIREVRQELRDEVADRLRDLCVKIAADLRERDELTVRLHGWGQSLRALGEIIDRSHTKVSRIIADAATAAPPETDR